MMTRAWKSNGGLDLIVIDYLTRIKPEKSQHNKNIEVGETVTAIKSLAKMIETPVILLAQLNRSGASRANPRPVMTDLRDSGVIEQEADNILMLYRPEGESPEIIIEKNRHGSCGVVMCDFIQEVMEWRSKNVWN
jgi:replicative DNA helicase